VLFSKVIESNIEPAVPSHIVGAVGADSVPVGFRSAAVAKETCTDRTGLQEQGAATVLECIAFALGVVRSGHFLCKATLGPHGTAKRAVDAGRDHATATEEGLDVRRAGGARGWWSVAFIIWLGMEKDDVALLWREPVELFSESPKASVTGQRLSVPGEVHLAHVAKPKAGAIERDLEGPAVFVDTLEGDRNSRGFRRRFEGL